MTSLHWALKLITITIMYRNVPETFSMNWRTYNDGNITTTTQIFNIYNMSSGNQSVCGSTMCHHGQCMSAYSIQCICDFGYFGQDCANGGQNFTILFGKKINLTLFSLVVEAKAIRDDPLGSNLPIVTQWYCRQIDEKWPAEPANVTVQVNRRKASDDGQFHGCFGNGPGQIPVPGYSIELNTEEMNSGLTYELMAMVIVDGNEALRKSLWISVEAVHAPIVSIRCPDGCNNVSASQPIRRVAVCEFNCQTKLGYFYVRWTLKIAATGKIIVDNSNVQGSSAYYFYLKPRTLYNKPGKYKLVLQAWLLGSDISTVTEDINVLDPPLGGFCVVEPNTGYSLNTNFTMFCKNWRSQLRQAALQYDFYVGFNDSWVFLHSTNYTTLVQVIYSQPLPVGRAANNYQLQVYFIIKDRIGGHSGTITQIHVQPPFKVAEAQSMASQILTADIHQTQFIIDLNILSGIASHPENIYVISNVTVPQVLIPQALNRLLLLGTDYAAKQTIALLQDFFDRTGQVDYDVIDPSVQIVAQLLTLYMNHTRYKFDGHSEFADMYTLTTTLANHVRDILIYVQLSSSQQTVLQRNVLLLQDMLSQLIDFGKIHIVKMWDPPFELSREFQSFYISKHFAYELNFKKVESEIADVNFPNVQFNLAEKYQCVGSLFQFINKCLFDIDREFECLFVFQGELFNCTDEETHGLRNIPIPQLQNSLTNVTVFVPFDYWKVSKPIYVNVPARAGDIVYHEVPMNTLVPLIISVRSPTNSSLIVLIGFNAPPTLQNFIYLLDVLKGSANSSHMAQGSLKISGQTLMNYNVEQVYLGVVKEVGDVNPNIQYYYIIASEDCLIWKPAARTWSHTLGCQIDSSIVGQLMFSSLISGTYAITLNRPSVVTTVGLTVTSVIPFRVGNALVLNTIIFIFTVYISLSLFFWRWDRHNICEWQIVAIPSEARGAYGYEIYFDTLSAPLDCNQGLIFLQINGTSATSQPIMMNNELSERFHAGCIDACYWSSSVHFGTIKSIVISLQTSQTDVTPLWYLSRVVIVDFLDCTWYVFELDNWISALMNLGEHTLHPAPITHPSTYLTRKQLFVHNWKYLMSNRHTILSVFKKCARTNMTRMQYLASSMAVAEWSMACSAVLINESTTGTLSLWASTTIDAAYVTTALVAAIAEFYFFLFQHASFMSDTLKARYVTYRPEKLVKAHPVTLPPWAVYMTHGLLHLAVVLTALFGLRCAYTWSDAAAEIWLGSVVLAIIANFTVIQVCKVTIAAFFNTFYLSEDTSYDSYKYRYGPCDVPKTADDSVISPSAIARYRQTHQHVHLP